MQGGAKALAHVWLGMRTMFLGVLMAELRSENSRQKHFLSNCSRTRFSDENHSHVIFRFRSTRGDLLNSAISPAFYDFKVVPPMRVRAMQQNPHNSMHLWNLVSSNSGIKVIVHGCMSRCHYRDKISSCKKKTSKWALGLFW